MREIEKRVEKIRQEINKHNYRYYILNSPVISDYEYDQLYAELKKLEAMYPELITLDSPTQRVSGELTGGFKKTSHSIPMLSLENTYSEEEVKEFDKKVRKELGEKIEYVVELKIDGVAVSIIYEGGKLVRASTRGDGFIGDEVTHNIRTITTVPLILFSSQTIEVRGEVFIPKKSFEVLNNERAKQGNKLFANPRNAAAGTLKHLNPIDIIGRKLDIFIHTSPYPIADTHWLALAKFVEFGLKANDNRKLCKSIFEVIDYCSSWKDKRFELPYEVDGMVIKVNSFQSQQVLGSTGKNPRWAIAYKFPAIQATTKLENIILQVGRTGIITPVAVLTPVTLAGSVISRATLHNACEISRKDIRIGDTVFIEKGGEVIPEVVKPVIEKRTGKEESFKIPEHCPVCGSQLVRKDKEVAWRCENLQCPAQIQKRIEHFVQRSAMNIDGLGEKVIVQLLSVGLIKDFTDIYQLKREELIKVERMGEKSADNLLNAIKDSRKRELSRLLFALGIKHIGIHTAKLLANKFHNIDNIIRASVEEINSIPGIGYTIAESVVEFFKDKKNLDDIEKLKRNGVNYETRTFVNGTNGDSKSNALSGKTFVLTGILSSFSRGEATRLVESFGGMVSSSVSKNTDYVVAGESPGSKYEKAKQIGINIISEKEFIQMIKSATSK